MKLAKIAVLAALGAFAVSTTHAAPLVSPATKVGSDSILVEAQTKKKVAKKAAKKKVAKKAVKKKRVVKARKARKVRKVAKVRVKAAKSCGTYMYRKGKKCMDARAKK